MKYFKEFFALTLLTILLFACTEKVEEKTAKEEDSAKDVITASVTYSVNGGEDILKLVDVSIAYADKDGKSEETKIESLPWTKEINGLPLPFNAASELKVTKKNDPDLSAEKYKVGLNSDISWRKSDGSFESSGISNNMTIASAKVDAYIDKLIEKGFKKSIEITE